MKIKFSKHAENKLKERNLKISIVEKILKKPDFTYYDLFSKATIAIGKVEIEGVQTNIVIPFIKEGNIFKIITVYPCKELKKEIKKKEGIRWVKIR